MTRSYLPLNSLRAFEAAARHLSFTHAAIELNVTHSAISQHVKALEQHLNCQLFVRVSRGLMLTTEGENLLPVLNDSFDRIAGMLDRFASQRAKEKLKIGVVGTFATGVLFSELADFRRCYPHIDLQLSTHNNRVDPAAEGLDYAIRYGGGAWHGTDAEFLCPAPLSALSVPDAASPASALVFPAVELPPHPASIPTVIAAHINAAKTFFFIHLPPKCFSLSDRKYLLFSDDLPCDTCFSVRSAV